MTAPSTTDSDTEPKPRRGLSAWLRVGIALFAIAWGGNEFTPLLVVYRNDEHLSALAVNLLLAAYVLGIVPAMLIGGPLSDRYGRRPLLLPAPVIALAGSALLAFAGGSPVLLFIGRILSGIALGLAMAVGTAWMKELSQPPFDAKADSGAGARRAALSLTIGFALGAGVAAALAQFGPWPETLPYLLNVVICAAASLVLAPAAESRARATTPGRLRDDLRIPAATHRRFLFVVLPMAPWVFGTAASAYAILPVLLAPQVPGYQVGLAGLLCLVALGCGVGIQSAAHRLDRTVDARGVLAALAVTVPALAVAALAAVTLSVALAIVAAAVLGLSYGLLLVSGLQEVQRIARADDLAGLTAVYYSLTYAGFFIPAILAALNSYIGYPLMFLAGSLIAGACLVVVAVNSTRHLDLR